MTRVIIVGDVRVRRDALALALSGLGFEILAATSSADAAEAVGQNGPTLVVLDLPASSGTPLVRDLTAVEPAAMLVALGVSERDEEIVAWVEAGASSYSTADETLDQLAATMHRVVAGEALASPRAVAALMRRVAMLSAEASKVAAEALTDREEDVASLLQAGMSNKEIAQYLSIEVATVKNHVHNILGKLNVKRRGEAVALIQGSSRLGLVPRVEMDQKI